ncbi:hypothetical protein [Escherichia coli]|uniref:hypothetical protein n=1 Tax=Escherichia coli TaxID=562 RepID=UPI00111F9371|nr:hypothetical protein [Escherichia coli]TNR80602.1 hypothetical protein FIC34_01825 [Escherichia coli]
MKLFEMEGFLRGKCLPGDMKVNETNAEYLVRKFTELEQKLAESQRELRAADATIENLQMQLNAEREAKLALAAENAGMKSAVIERKNLSEEIRKAGRPPHTDFWHQSIYMADKKVDDALNSTPATDAFLAEVRAQGVEMAACSLDDVNQFNYANMLDDLAQKIRKGVQP